MILLTKEWLLIIGVILFMGIMASALSAVFHYHLSPGDVPICSNATMVVDILRDCS